MAEQVQAGTYEEWLALGHKGGFVVTAPPDKRGLYIAEKDAPWTSFSSGVFSVKDTPYSAKGDGVSDDTAAIQAAITAAAATSGGGVVYLPRGTYFIATSLTLLANVTLRGDGMGATILKFSDTSAATMFTGSGATLSTTNPSIAINIGDRTATLVSNAGFAVDDWVSFIDNVNFRGWVGRVGAVLAGNKVTFQEKLPNDYPTTMGLTRFTPLKKVAIRDLTITNPTGNSLDNRVRLNGAISLTHAVDTHIENVEFLGISGDTGGQGLLFERCRNTTLRGLRFDRCGDGTAADTVQNTRVIEPRNCTQILIEGCHFLRSGASADLSFTGCNHVVVHGNVISGQTDWVGNNLWTLHETGGPTGGTFTITVTPQGGGAVTTAAIPFNATAAQIQAAINLVLSAGQSVTAKGGPLNTTDVAIAFSGNLDGTTGTIALAVNSLTGGAGPTVTFTQTNAGTNGLSTDNGGRGCKFEIGNSFCVASANIINGPGFDGFRCVGSRNIEFIGNVIAFAHDVSFNIQDEGSGACTDISIIGNQIFMPSNANGGQHGIYLSNVLRAVVANNKLNNIQATEGIYLNNTCTDCIVQGNIISTTGFYGIRIGSGASAAARNIVSNNIVRGSVTNSINTAGTAAGTNAVFGNIVDRAVSLHASDKKINDSAAADSNWVL